MLVTEDGVRNVYGSGIGSTKHSVIRCSKGKALACINAKASLVSDSAHRNEVGGVEILNPDNPHCSNIT
jgi:hypothetical protein